MSDKYDMAPARQRKAPAAPIITANTPKAAFQLTKTKYCTGLQCLKALYLTIHNRELATPPDESQQQRFDYGKLVGAEAQKHYPDGVLIEADHFHRDEAIDDTRVAIQKSAPAIFEAAFFWNNVLVRVDILRNNNDGSWDIIEVKSSTQAKPEHIPDMAIQCKISKLGAG